MVISSDESVDGFDIKQYFISEKDKHNKKENDKKVKQNLEEIKKKRKRLIESSDSEEEVTNNENKESISTKIIINILNNF